jgi:hypothetical protein
MAEHDFFLDCRPKDNRTKISHLTMYRGDTLAFRLILSDQGTPVDLTGGYLWWTVKDDINDPDADAIFRKELGNGITIPYPTLGQVLVTLDPSETIALQQEEAKSYYWDLQYQDNDGIVHTVFIGKLTILLDVTENKGFVVGASGIIITAQLQGGPFVAGVNDVADGDGLADNERQSIHIDGVTGGTFTLTVEDPNNVGNFETTLPIAWNASAAAIESSLETDITFIDGVACTGGPLNTSPVVVEFDGALLALLNVSLMTMDVSLLT